MAFSRPQQWGIGVAMSVVIVFVLTFFIIATSNIADIDKAFQKGARMSLACGREYIEAETDKHALYAEFSSKGTGIGKRFMDSFHILRIAILLAIVVFACFVYFVKFDTTQQPPPSLNAFQKYIPMITYVGAAIYGVVFLVTSFTALHLREAKIFSQATNADSENASKAHRDSLLGVFLPFAGVLAGWSLYVWKVMSSLASDNDKNKLQTLLWLMGGFFAVWMVIFGIYFWYSKGFFRIATAVNSGYNMTLAKELQDSTTEIYSKYIVADMGKGGLLNDVMANVKDMFVRHFGGNIRRFEQTDGDDIAIVKEKKDSLWKYMMHKDGKELEDVRLYVQDTLGHVTGNATDAIVTWRDGLLAMIAKIRNTMRTIRNDTGIKGDVKSYLKDATIFASVVFGAILFLVFHVCYMANAGRTVLVSTAFIIVFTVFATYIGWVNSTMRL